MEAVFMTTGQAVHVSFLMLSLPAMEENQFCKALIAAMEAALELSKSNEKWLDRLRGQPSESVNFAGLSMIEVRGQCSMITGAVATRLPRYEMCMMLAKYGVGPQKQQGVNGLVDFSRRACGINAFAPVYKLIAARFLPKDERDGLSYRDIGKDHNLSKDKVFRAAKWMEQHLGSLEMLALERLQRKFLEHGVVEEAEELKELPKAAEPKKPSRRSLRCKATPEKEIEENCA
jgi:hypothetical protein